MVRARGMENTIFENIFKMKKVSFYFKYFTKYQTHALNPKLIIQ